MKAHASYFEWRRRKDNRDGIIFLLPAMAAYMVFIAVPILMAVGLCFLNYNLLTPPRWNGINNIKRLFIDPLFLQTLKNTFKFFALLTPIHCILALGLAYVVSQIQNNAIRSLY
ncbi:MAG: hypothetical protein LBI90_04560, partial [Treponema sp.]|nr:hypothetical protein [Treponema sp.]